MIPNFVVVWLRAKPVTMTTLEGFDQLEDPRCSRDLQYTFEGLLFLILTAVVSDCNSPTEISLFGSMHLAWYQRHGHFLDGRTPSHDTVGDLLKRLDPEAFQACFTNWMAHLCNLSEGALLVVDGKRLRGSYDRFDGKEAIHMVSLWSRENQMVLGQLAVDDKSNEITAIPLLLKILDIEGATVSIDAIGCQREIVKQIRDQKAHYLIGLKGNQPSLMEEVEMAFVHHRPSSSHRDDTKGHGRVETRICHVIDDPSLVDCHQQWEGLASLVRVQSITYDVLEKKTTEQVRFYISSLSTDAEKFNELVRGHWSIENQLHWCLDVNFGEDASRIRKGHGDQNMATIRRAALTLCKLDNAKKWSLKLKRKAAAYSDAYRERLLRLQTR